MKRRRLSCFLFLGLLGYANGSLLSPDATTTLNIGFQRESDLFECLPGDKVRLEEAEGGKVMRWDVNYVSKQYRVCVKELDPGIVSGMTTMSFRLRAESRHQLWLQINEKSGERFYEIITADSGWKKLSSRLGDLNLNEDKVVNGRRDLDHITKILR